MIKNKLNGKIGRADLCSTPNYAVEPLLPYIPPNSIIYESASGEGYIINYLINYFQLISTEITLGTNYFERKIINYDIEITNPPFSKKYLWLAEAYQRNKPFCLLLPCETIGAGAAQDLFKKYGIQIIYMSPRVDFKTPNKKWCWIDNEPYKIKNGKKVKNERFGKLVHSSSQFPTAWFCWKMNLPSDIMFVDITEGKKQWRQRVEVDFRNSVLLHK